MAYTNKKFAEKVVATIVAVTMATSPLLAAFAAAPVTPIAPQNPETPVYVETLPMTPVSPVAPISPVTVTDPAPTETQAVVNNPEITPTNENILPSENSSLAEGTSSSPEALGVTNNDTGAGSTNNASVGPVLQDGEKQLGASGNATITNNNLAMLDNIFNLGANSGGNTSSYNTGNGEAVSGDANVMLSVLNLINTVFIAPKGGQIGLMIGNILGDLIGDYLFGPAGEIYSLTGSRLDVGNSNTGANSTNSALVNAGGDTTIRNVNDGTVNNGIAINADTGKNEASYNTGNGSVSSGDANVSLNLLNFLNSSFYAENQGLFGILNIFGDFIGNLIIPKAIVDSPNDGSGTFGVSAKNENTGADSENNAEINLDENTTINNENTSGITNAVDIAGNSGGNGSSYNTGSGSSESGNVDSDLNVSNTANQNIVGDNVFYAIINVMGKWAGANLLASLFNTVVIPNADGSGETIVVTNDLTGSGSVNSAEVNMTDNSNISNTNDASIGNDIDINANTGGNSSSYNTGNGSVKSGNVNVLANILNMANLNVVAKKFSFFVVNIFGDWNGNIADVASVTSGTAANSSNTSQSSFVASGTGPTEIAYHGSEPSYRYRKIFGTRTLASVSEPVDTEVLSANSSDAPYSLDKSDTGSESALVKFLRNNIWNMMIVMIIAIITWGAYLYERQRTGIINKYL